MLNYPFFDQIKPINIADVLRLLIRKQISYQALSMFARYSQNKSTTKMI